MDGLMRRLYQACLNSLSGLTYAFRTQAAFRQDILLFAAGTTLAFIADVSNMHRILLVGSLFAILIVELLNTAIEITIDRISTEQHLLSKYAKDLGSAAVLITLAAAAFTWAMVFLG